MLTRLRSAGPVLALFASETLLLFVTGLPAQQGTKSETTKRSESKPVAPEQPVPFSHKTHAAFQLQCKFCHPNPDPGNEMTIPVAAKCMGCHVNVAKDKPLIKVLTEFTKDHETIPWVRLYAVPAFVYWSHRTHLEAKMKCETCHGDVAQMDITTKVTNMTTMSGCVECHKQNNGSRGCAICHEALSSKIWKHEARGLPMSDCKLGS